jgi:hypothetical protein
MKAILEKIWEYVSICLGFCLGIAWVGFLAGALIILLAGKLVPSFPSEFFAPVAHNIADWRSLVVIAIGCLAIGCIFLILTVVSRTPWIVQRRASATQKTEQEKKKASRKRWIIGLLLLALFLAYNGADDCIRYYKRFNKSDSLATAHVVEFDPGESSGGDDPGRAAASRYEFTVNGKTYDGWTEDELSEGEPIEVRYNSSDPSLNYAKADHADWPGRIFKNGFFLFITLAVLVGFIRAKQ